MTGWGVRGDEGAARTGARAGAPEKIMRGVCHSGSSFILRRMWKRRWAPRRAMKAVPGVMQLLSNASTPSGGTSPFRAAAAAACSPISMQTCATWTPACVRRRRVWCCTHRKIMK